jgi:hypothetical protein
MFPPEPPVARIIWLADAIDAQVRQRFPDSGYVARVEYPELPSEPDARYAYRRDLTEML